MRLPASGPHLVLFDEAAAQHPLHGCHHHIVFREPSPRGVEQGRAVRDALRHDPVTGLADNDVGSGDEVFVAQFESLELVASNAPESASRG